MPSLAVPLSQRSRAVSPRSGSSTAHVKFATQPKTTHGNGIVEKVNNQLSNLVGKEKVPVTITMKIHDGNDEQKPDMIVMFQLRIDFNHLSDDVTLKLLL